MENVRGVEISRQNSCKNIKDNDNNNNRNKENQIDRGYGYVIVIAAFFSNVIVDGIIYTMGMIEDELLVEFNEGKSFTSWVPSIMSGMELCVGPIASSLINKYNCRTVAIIGSIFGAACFFISAYAQNVTSLIITIGFGVGTGLGLIYLTVIVSLLTYFEKYRSVATGFAFAGTGVGATAFAPLVAFLIEFGWRRCLMALAVILLNCSLLGALFRPLKVTKKHQNINNITEVYINQSSNQHLSLENCDSKQNNKINRDNEGQENKYDGKQNVSTFKKCCDFMNLNLLNNPVFVLFIISDFVTSMCLYVPYYSLASYASALGMKEDGPRLLMITGISNILGPFIMGYICDRTSYRLWIYIGCLTICSIAIALFIICKNFLSLAICSAVFAFNIGACVSLRSIILTDLLGLDDIENAFGLLLLFEGVGTFLGPPIDGFLHDLSNSYTPGFLFTSIMITFSGIILLPMPALESYVKKKQSKYGNNETENQK